MVAAVRNTTNTSVNGIEAVGLEAEDSDAYLAVYGACVGVFCALAVFRSIMLTSFQVRSCAFHHSRLLQSLVWDNAFATRAVRAVAAELDEIDHKNAGQYVFLDAVGGPRGTATRLHYDGRECSSEHSF